MSGQLIPVSLPEDWVARWRPAWFGVEEQEALAQQAMGKTSVPANFPTTFQDRPEDFPEQPRRWTISRTNRHTVALVRHLLIPPSVRQAFPSVQNRSPLAGLFDLLHLQGSATPSRSKTLETQKGMLLLRDFCPPSLVDRLTADVGLRAFARIPEREHQLLVSIAKRPDCALTVAHTHGGECVGGVAVAPGGEGGGGVESVWGGGIGEV